jgi:FixJ family two-component response regulator
MTQTNASWVYVVDDDPPVLKAIQRLLQTEGYNVCAFVSPRAFLDAHDPTLPGCALLDVGMAELDGLETLNALLALGETRPVIFITGRDNVQTSVMAMKAGASDYLIKPVAESVLLTAVATAVQGDVAARRECVKLAELSRRWQSLTPREAEVIKLVVRGWLNKQIAGDLNISEKTVKVHRARAMEKMEVRSVARFIHIMSQLEQAGSVTKADNASDFR